jgi:NH3-dependent NAD+ synthetase
VENVKKTIALLFLGFIILCFVPKMADETKVKTQINETSVETMADQVYSAGILLIGKPLATLLTQTEAMGIQDQTEAKSISGRIRITYTYADDSKLAIVCTSNKTELIIFGIMKPGGKKNDKQ